MRWLRSPRQADHHDQAGHDQRHVQVLVEQLARDLEVLGLEFEQHPQQGQGGEAIDTRPKRAACQDRRPDDNGTQGHELERQRAEQTLAGNPVRQRQRVRVQRLAVERRRVALACVHQRAVQQDVAGGALVDQPVVEARQNRGAIDQGSVEQDPVRQKYQRYATQRGSGETAGPSPQQSEGNPHGDRSADGSISDSTRRGAELDARGARLAAHVRTAERLERRAWCALPAHA